MDAMIHVGANEEAVLAARDTILAILNAPAEDKTKLMALKILATVCDVNHTVISDCTFVSEHPTE